MVLRNLIILPDAEQDAAQAYVWYEDQELGLGEEFLRCVDACIQSIWRSPGMYQKAIEGVWFGAFLTLFSMSIQILQLVSTQFSTVLKTQRNGVVGCHRIDWAQQNNRCSGRIKLVCRDVKVTRCYN
jgi:hypothetical protein